MSRRARSSTLTYVVGVHREQLAREATARTLLCLCSSDVVLPELVPDLPETRVVRVGGLLRRPESLEEEDLAGCPDRL